MKHSHGSSQFATNDELEEAGFVNTNGIPLGYRAETEGGQGDYLIVGYAGEQHMLTVAPTRSGKGTCAIVPALLEHGGGVLCIDPKGENAIITAAARAAMTGQQVHILDPWRLACDVLECEPAQFNPLDMLKPDSPDLVDDALMVADALVVPGHAESFWVDEARAMIMGFILYLVCSPDEEGKRTLGRLREILSASPKEFMRIRDAMCDMTSEKLVMNAGNRIKQKSERELASVISTAQQNTHFLESAKIQKSVERTTFDFGDLKNAKKPISIYLVLPADRLNTHGRWLRLLVSMAITAMVRTDGKPKTPALFILDEFAALGRLSVVEQAYGLMAGFGMTIWAILQDLSQLQDLYRNRWQTFIANAGVLQAFGTRDTFTAEYLSKLCGKTTIERLSKETRWQRSSGIFSSGNPDHLEMEDQFFGRSLMMPEEVMRMHPENQLVFLPQCNPALALKVPYYKNGRYFDERDNTAYFRVHPNYQDMKLWFNNYDEKTDARMNRAWEGKEEEILDWNEEEAENLELFNRYQEARDKEREEMLSNAREATGTAFKSAGRFAKFMGAKLKEGQKKQGLSDEDDLPKDGS